MGAHRQSSTEPCGSSGLEGSQPPNIEDCAQLGRLSKASYVCGAQEALGRGGIQRSSSSGGSANGTPSHMR